MPIELDVKFVPLSASHQPTTVVLAGKDGALGAAAQSLDNKAGQALRHAMEAAEFKGRPKTSIELLAPPRLDTKRLIIAGAGGELDSNDRYNLGGAVLAAIGARKTSTASVVVDLPELSASKAVDLAADLAAGAVLRSYTFKTYQTKHAEDEANGGAKPGVKTLFLHVADPDKASEAYAERAALARGVSMARDLVNEPPNTLGPVEFAERLKALNVPGLEVEVLDETQLADLKMGALLGVAQGSERPARVVVMQWNGAKSKRARPVCFVGKGVTFDTGGISLKPGAGMEDMKGDMGGAACVSGLMLALAGRKANVNAVGLVGLVENMPSGKAQRPGDIVTTMSGQTVEIINTDAEGRLVLADVLWYAQERFKPRFIVDLATLTGAIMVALGKEYAGLFSNNDRLSEELSRAGEATGEKVWRMPLAKAYDKLIDSRFADMKNTGGRHGGSITAAQFLLRFIKDTPWAHLDIAGTAMDSGRSDINQSWGSGWGVRLLDRLVSDNYERPEK